MKVTFETSVESFEKANYMIGLAIRAYESRSDEWLKENDLTQNDIKLLKTFSSQLVKGFLKQTIIK